MRALFEDARQQVLDNTVFRLLLLLTAIPILFTFMVGFHEEHISLLWGWQEITYKDFMSNFGGVPAGTTDMGARAIQAVQSATLTFFVGSLGMMLCIAATAFFAPRILEKGAADTLFSKPVTRMAILLSRYFAGILFVAFISSILVLGMYLGFWINSGHNDPGFLWGAITLVYLYAMMHAFSMVVAVFTKSSTAAILLTIALFMVSGGVHGAWLTIEFFQGQEQVALLRAGGDEEDDEDKDEESPILDALATTVAVAHYILPKTSDADIITEKLRRALTESTPLIDTDNGDFLLKSGPIGFVMVEDSADGFEGAGMKWVPESEEDAGADTVSIKRYPRPEVEKTIGSRTRTRSLLSKDVAKERKAELEEQGAKVELDNTKLSGVRTYRLIWTAKGETTRHRDLFFHFDDWIYEFEISGEPSEMDSRQSRIMRRRFLEHGNIILGKISGMDPKTWYMDAFTWDAEWKYNILFSIGSSLAFIFSMLGIAWLRLRRLDF